MSAFTEWNTFSPKVCRELNSAPALLYFLALVFVSLHRDPDFLLHHQQARQSGVPGFSGPSGQPSVSSLKWLSGDNAICAAWDAGSIRSNSVLLMRIVSFAAPDA